MKPEAARRIAARRNQRARDEMPLFADLLGEITADSILEAHREHAKRFQQKLTELQAQGDSWRAQVAERVSAAELACLDSRRLNMKAEMELTILEDGTISITTGNMAGEHHASADEFIKLVHQLAGGARETKSTHEHHHHYHHEHQEHKH